MAVIPRRLSPGIGMSRGYTGYELHDTEPQNIHARGQVEGGLLRQQLEARLREAQIGAGTDRHRVDASAAADRFAQLQGADTARRGQDVASQTAQLGADTARRGQDLSFQASMAPINWSRERFGQLFPLVQSELSGGVDRVGGASRPLPGVTVGGVWDDNQVQQQVNAARAGIDQRTAGRQQQAGRSAAGRGFSPSSPLLQALSTQIGNAGMAAGADAERGIRWDAAEGNARQRLSAEQLAQQQWSDYEDADIRRRQAATTRTGTLLQALAAM